jgi:hypothetical protein
MHNFSSVTDNFLEICPGTGWPSGSRDISASQFYSVQCKDPIIDLGDEAKLK